MARQKVSRKEYERIHFIHLFIIYPSSTENFKIGRDGPSANQSFPRFLMVTPDYKAYVSTVLTNEN